MVWADLGLQKGTKEIYIQIIWIGQPQSVKIVQGTFSYPSAGQKQGILHIPILYCIQNLYYLTPSPNLPIYMQFAQASEVKRWEQLNASMLSSQSCLGIKEILLSPWIEFMSSVAVC